jgi:hypothetical protein
MNNMRWITSFLVGYALTVSGTVTPDETKLTYTVQLIRATDNCESLPRGSTPVDPELAGIFHGPLKWQHYWKICERQMAVSEGQAKRIPLINSRDVEIDLTKRNERTVTAFQRGNFMGRATVPVGKGFSLIGGKRDYKSSWFIVVRRDALRD